MPSVFPESVDPLSARVQPCDGSHSTWAVVGGGMLGLATAYKLAKAGKRVTLFEAADSIGGLTSAWQLGDIEWDKFYHVVLLSDVKLRNLLEELDLEREMRWVTTRTGFLCDGRLVSLSSSIDFLFFPPLNLWQKFRLGCTILYASRIRSSTSLEHIPVADWLRKLSGRRTFERIWLPLLKSKLGDAYERTSAAFIWSYIDRMYKARRSGMKREMFGYVPGGYRRILQRLTDRLCEMGVCIRTSSPVEKIESTGSSPQLVVTTRCSGDATSEHAEHRFDHVIMTNPSPWIVGSCPQLTADERERLSGGEYLGVVCTSLLLDRPLGGYYVTNIIDDGVPLTGIIEMGAIVDPQYLGGGYLVYLPQYLLANDARFEESDEVVHERALSTLERIYPHFNRSQVRAIQTARARHVMALPALNYSQRLPAVKSSVAGLYLLNSAQITVGNLNVNEVLEIVDREFDGLIGHGGPKHHLDAIP
jgi:protoporphyrinogen oxidase